jgi:hypothetical protein
MGKTRWLIQNEIIRTSITELKHYEKPKQNIPFHQPVRVRAGIAVTRVTRRGESVDYWIGNREYVLEVSGQQTGNLEYLRDEKAKQLCKNPMEKPGYVSVTNFQKRRSYLCYYEVADES